ncbi:carbohydrate ABC transporter permease [Bradyrhizobium sp.]|jgi:multiple sugar transport system permease protein|uniref:carbohydrate ABC transporter permease n=1 Tax=Bradyrhizobium sp. TaxID=376 RepID=UPI003C1D42BD
MRDHRRRQLERALDSEALWPLMVGFSALYLAFFVGYPVIYNLIMSVQHVTLGNIRFLVRPFVGLDNYAKLVADPLFAMVVQNTLLFVVGNVALQFLGGLALALFFQQPFPGASFFRGLILAGWILPPLVIGAVWKWLLASDNGIINYALHGLGLTSGPVYWLSDPATSLIGVTMANVWFGVPFNMILLSAGLAGVPRDIYEAAALDGAGPLRRFFAITLPLLRPTIYALLALSTIYTMRAFDLIWTMTHGGPVDSSNIFPVWAYRLSFELFDFGGGAAVSTMMLVVVFIVALIYVRSVRAEQLS